MIYKNIFKFALSLLSSFVVDYIVYAIAILFYQQRQQVSEFSS